MSIKDLVIDWWADHADEWVSHPTGRTYWMLVEHDGAIMAGTEPCDTEQQLMDKYYDKAIAIVTDNLADMADMKRDEMRGN